jgi:hypothetical protein
MLSATMACAIVSMMLPNAPADESQDTAAAVAPQSQVETAPQTPAPHTNPRRIYKVDDIGMIIGGASEDAKAKVGRLRIQD